MNFDAFHAKTKSSPVCAFQPFCGADPVYHYATQGDMFGHRATSGFCAKNMGVIRHLFELLDSGDREVERTVVFDAGEVGEVPRLLDAMAVAVEADASGEGDTDERDKR